VFNGPTVDFFAVVKNLEAALSGNDSEGIDRSIGDLDRVLTQVSVARGEIGALEARLEGTSSGLDETKGIVTQILSHHEDADLAKTISDLTLQQVALEAASQTVSRLFENSLLKFLR
jgi:flagellar hook-associated protein 3 FlgL